MNDVSSRTTTPGGGSVAALVGALSTSMASMSANFTLGKDRFRDVEPKIREILENSNNGREDLLRLMEEDIEAYNEVVRAYSLPKSSDEEKEQRSSAIQNGMKKAIDVPLRTMNCTLKLLKYINELVKIVNPNLITDIGVGGLLADAAFRGAMLNVEYNLNYIKDKEMVDSIKEEIVRDMDRANGLIGDFMLNVKERMHRAA